MERSRKIGAAVGVVEKLRYEDGYLPINSVAARMEYSVATRDPEKGVIPLCDERGIGFVPYRERWRSSGDRRCSC